MQLKKWDKLYSLVYWGQVFNSNCKILPLSHSHESPVLFCFVCSYMFSSSDIWIAMQNVIPYAILHLLFGLMWWRREIVIVNDEVWGDIEHTHKFMVFQSSEASCGWESLKNSHSGRLQVSLEV